MGNHTIGNIHKFKDRDGKERIVRIGDEVVYNDNKRGFLAGVCYCSMCKDRGFYELIVRKEANGENDYLTSYDHSQGFSTIISIGTEKFNEFDNSFLDNLIEKHLVEIKNANEALYRLFKARSPQVEDNVRTK